MTESLREGGLTIMSNGLPPSDNEFRARFKGNTNQELIDAFNRQVGNPGWVSPRASYLEVLYSELKRRGFDVTALGDERSFPLARKVRLIGIVVEPVK